MRLGAAEALQLRSWVPTALHGQVRLGQVSGGRPTDRYWGSQISNTALHEAIDESLRDLGLVPSTPDAGRYQLQVKLVALEQPLIGLDIKVAVTLDYTLLDKETEGKVAYQRRLRTQHSSAFADAMLDPNTRTRLASEAAVRENVNAMVREWMSMAWN